MILSLGPRLCVFGVLRSILFKVILAYIIVRIVDYCRHIVKIQFTFGQLCENPEAN